MGGLYAPLFTIKMNDKQFKMAQTLHQRGELKKALNIYRAIRLPVRTRQVDIYHSLCLIQLGRLEEAQSVISLVDLSKLEQYAELVTTALVVKSLGQIEDCINLLHQALKKYPDKPVIHLNLAVVYLALDKVEESEKQLKLALSLGLDSAELRLNQAQIAIRKFDLEEAENFIQLAVAKNPGHCDIFYLRGVICEQQYDIPSAYTNYVEALKRNISSPTAWERLSIIFNEGSWFRNEVDIKSLSSLFKAAKEQNIASLKTLTQIVTIQKKSLIWDELDYFEQLLIDGLGRDGQVTAPSPFVTLTLPINQKEITKAYIFQHKSIKHSSSIKKKRPSSKPRIAFISSDLRNHAVGYLLKDIIKTSEIFSNYDCIYTGEPELSDVYQLYKSSFNRFYEGGALTTEDKISIIKDREIDILVDLNGFTGRPSIEMFRKLDIPLVHWLGLPSSTGAEIFDFLICDPIVLPPQEKDSISETPIYLPITYVPSRDFILNSNKNEIFTFGSFQNGFKLNPILLKTWSEILNICSDAKFVIASSEIDKEALINLLKHYNFDMNRTEIVQFLRVDHHLKRLANVDCILDTFPYNGGTSCADALEKGVPVVSLYGEAIVSRVASSILRSAGLDELIAKNIENYKEIAINLYQEKNKKDDLLKKISASYFAQPAQFARDFHRCLIEQVSAHYD